MTKKTLKYKEYFKPYYEKKERTWLACVSRPWSTGDGGLAQRDGTALEETSRYQSKQLLPGRKDMTLLAYNISDAVFTKVGEKMVNGKLRITIELQEGVRSSEVPTTPIFITKGDGIPVVFTKER